MNIEWQFKRAMLRPGYPCVGARSTFQEGNYQLQVYNEMLSDSSTWALGHDLIKFVNYNGSGRFVTFVAVFKNPESEGERHFEWCLWEQLQELHNIDESRWDQSVSSDPNSPRFEFSFGGVAFFVVGMHKQAHRRARQFDYCTLVFNRHSQFQELRASGHYNKMQQTIRQRDNKFSGPNPNVNDFGLVSDARQYSGRDVEPNWICPFKAK